MTILKEIDGVLLERAFKSATSNLNLNKEYVNSLNVFPVPDGDTGTNMYKTLSSATSSIKSNDSVSEVAKSVSKGALMGARGNSGVILSQILKGFYTGLEDCKTASIEDFDLAFEESKNAAYKAVMKPTEGTILTIVREIAEFSSNNYSDFDDLVLYLQACIDHGNKILDKTPDMLKELKDAGVVDAGAKGYLLILQGMVKGLVSDEIDHDINVDNFDFFANRSNHDPEETEHTYCTEFIINGSPENLEDFRDEISIDADSVIVVGDEDMTKVHIHTNNPGKILERALVIGDLSDIKIDNMKLQAQAANINNGLIYDNDSSNKDYDFVVISSGSGFDEIFKSLRVNNIIKGGQTMNPSTEDLLEAVNRSNAENIFIFPNNKNIIMSAQQVKDLTEKNVHVIETRQVPEAFSAILSFNPDLGPLDNKKRMIEAIEDVKTIQITYATRDSKNNNLEIKANDYIAIIDDEIKLNSLDLESLVMDTLEESVSDLDYLITIYYGEDMSDDEASKLARKIEDSYEDLDIDLIDGSQPVYNYIITIE